MSVYYFKKICFIEVGRIFLSYSSLVGLTKKFKFFLIKRIDLYKNNYNI